LDNEFIEFCELNNIKDVNKKAKEVFDRGFTILKYGELPGSNKEIVEVVKEITVEVPVEKIVEVKVPYEVEVIKEIIKEVPVEIVKEGETKTIIKEIIKEVPVEKIVEVTKEVINNKLVEELKKENERLNNELNHITDTLAKAAKARVMKNSDLGSLYDE